MKRSLSLVALLVLVLSLIGAESSASVAASILAKNSSSKDAVLAMESASTSKAKAKAKAKTTSKNKAKAKSASSEWPLLWRDEFSGKKGSSVDPDAWTAETGNSNGGWGNKEIEYYVPDAARLNGAGKLVITAAKAPKGLDCWMEADCPYTSARLNTFDKVELTTGRVEVRLKLPKGAGLWPAFWMLGSEGYWPDNGEIDVMEWIGSDKNVTGATIHGPSSTSENGYSMNGLTTLAKEGTFHTYAVEKRKNDIRWFLDGKEYYRVTASDLAAGDRWVFNEPFYFVLNLAVGGSWPGNPPASVTFPQKLVVDYVRVWGKGTAPE
jgi:beta-glucanase (GH16 family)